MSRFLSATSSSPASGTATEPAFNPKNRTTWHLGDVPPAAYRLPTDGRKWRATCVTRQRVTIALARFADSNGRNIQVGQERLASSLALCRRELGYVLADLLALKFLHNENLVWTHGKQVRRRSLDVGAILAAASDVHNSRSNVQYSPIDVQNRPCTQPCSESSDSTFFLKQGRADARDSSNSLKSNQETIPPTAWDALCEYADANLKDVEWREARRDRGALRRLWALCPDVDEILAAIDVGASLRSDSGGVFSIATEILKREAGESQHASIDLARTRTRVHAAKPNHTTSAATDTTGVNRALQKVGRL